MFEFKSVADAIEKFSSLVADSSDENIIKNRIEELNKASKEELIKMIISLEKRQTKGIGVGDLAKAILQDEEFITLSNGEVAEVCRTLIPGSNTSAKSIASYVSKKRVDWNLPQRLTIRRRK